MGIVTNVRATANEPFWSLNIKRGILSIIQINIHGIQTIKNALATQIIQRPDARAASKNFFIVREDCVFGECEAMYNIRKEPATPKGQKVMHINKVFNHKKCVNAPAYFNSLIKGLKLPDTIREVC
jgi:hypothetical protein